jgi:hypothetical protein
VRYCGSAKFVSTTITGRAGLGGIALRTPKPVPSLEVQVEDDHVGRHPAQRADSLAFRLHRAHSLDLGNLIEHFANAVGHASGVLDDQNSHVFGRVHAPLSKRAVR